MSPASATNVTLDSISVNNQYIISVEINALDETFIRVDGGFDYMFGYNLTRYINQYSPAYIELNSPGGSMDEISAPGAAISDAAIEVRVLAGEYCGSACAFLALYSPHIQSDGQIAFHLPYYVNYNYTLTLNDISHRLTQNTITNIAAFHDNNWALELYGMIARFTSDINVFMVFDTGEDLEQFRTTGPHEFVTHMPVGNYQIRTRQDIAEYAINQSQTR
jgi:hypothetical protein